MSALRIKTLSGAYLELSQDVVDDFAAHLRGQLLTAQSAHYDWARAVWNAAIDRRPALIAQCVIPWDVKVAVDFARKHRLLVSVRSGGHNIAGNAVSDDGLVIDLFAMRWVRIDPEARTAQVGPGATLGDLDRESQAYGLATPLGINSTTGVAGLTLGGGFGWLSRQFGLTVDNLLSVDLVTAAGEQLHVSEQEYPELFWGVRGGGGNFGVVTCFEFRLHPLGPEVLSGLIVFPVAQAEQVLKQYREYVPGLPECTSVWGVLLKAPPLAFLPADIHQQDVLALAFCHTGDEAEGRRLIDPLREMGKPLYESISLRPFVSWQSIFDPLFTGGARNYWKSHNFAELGDVMIRRMLEYQGEMPSLQCKTIIAHMGGATSRVETDDTAYPHRKMNYIVNIHSRWEYEAEDNVCIGWARQMFNVLSPHALGGVYVNFMTEDEKARVTAAYADNYPRLVQLKRKYDPDNLFRMNQNISP